MDTQFRETAAPQKYEIFSVLTFIVGMLGGAINLLLLHLLCLVFAAVAVVRLTNNPKQKGKTLLIIGALIGILDFCYFLANANIK